MRATKGEEQMNGYEILFLAISCFIAGYCWCYIQKGEEDERSSKTDDEVRNDKE